MKSGNERWSMDVRELLPKGRIVDLTHTLVPGKELYMLDVSRRNERSGEEGDIMSCVYLWSHVGTHVEAPLHFLASGSDTSWIAIDIFFGSAILVDFRRNEVNVLISLAIINSDCNINVGDRVM